MKRILRGFIALVVLAAVGAGAWFGWKTFGPKPQLGYAQVFATAPAPCPDDPSDLAGIEGWAPGAGKTAKIGETGTGNVGTLGGALGGDTSTPAPDDTKKCKGISPELDRYFARIAAAGEAIPATNYDAAVKASALEGKPATIFAFVRDGVATEAYPGAMRGANGTLAARGGSPADKALLLAALLSEKQIAVRFMHGSLSDGEIRSVVAAMTAARPAPPSSDDSEVLGKLGLDRAQVGAVAKEQRERVKQLADEGIARARSATDALLTAAPVKLAASDATVRSAWTAALRDHWWLQAQIDGAWTDLDPTLPGAKPGEHLATASGEAADALAADAYVKVTVALVGTFTGAETADKTLVTASAKTSDLSLTSFSVVIGDRGKGAQNLTEARSFTPSIGLGAEEQSGDAFDADGSSRLALLRLRITTQMPGATRTAERTVVDRRQRGGSAIDPAWTPQRTALALTSTYMGLVVPGELNRDFTAKQDAQAAKLARAFSAYVTAGGNGRQIPPPGIGEAYPYEVMHYFLYDAIARMRLEDQSGGTVRFFFDRPQVAMVHRGFTQHGKQRAGILEFDVVENGMAATGSGDGAVRANAVRGYMDTNIERHVLGVEPAENTIALFNAASRAGVKPKAVAQDAGSVRIVPDGQVSLGGRVVNGWWDVDPQTGNLLGRMQGGAGQALVEYAIDRVNDWSTLVTIMQFYGDFFRCIAMGVEAPLSGSANPQADFNNCALGALCNLAEATVVGEGFSRCDVCTQIDALIYNFLDYGTYGKSSSPGSFGYVCGKLFPSPF
ncbi:MAG TPA: hypothetical protein VGD01_17045 [Candidatus Elarobacter sp.]